MGVTGTYNVVSTLLFLPLALGNGCLGGIFLVGVLGGRDARLIALNSCHHMKKCVRASLKYSCAQGKSGCPSSEGSKMTQDDTTSGKYFPVDYRLNDSYGAAAAAAAAALPLRGFIPSFLMCMLVFTWNASHNFTTN